MLLARMAEAVYWAGRYLERAEDTARIVQVHGETHIDLPVGEDVGWAPLVEIAGTMAAYRERGSGSVRASLRAAAKRSAEARVVAYVLTDRDNPSSILASISAARDNLRRARPVVPREVWELCNELWVALSSDRHRRRRRATSGCGWLQRVIERDPAHQRGDAGHDATRRGAGVLSDGPASRAGRDHVPGARGAGRQRRARSRPRGLQRGAPDGPAPIAGLVPAVPARHARTRPTPRRRCGSCSRTRRSPGPCAPV